jgi:hypothetical protein
MAEKRAQRSQVSTDEAKRTNITHVYQISSYQMKTIVIEPSNPTDWQT